MSGCCWCYISLGGFIVGILIYIIIRAIKIRAIKYVIMRAIKTPPDGVDFRE